MWSFTLGFAGTAAACGVRIAEANELSSALSVLGLRPPQPTVVVVGGAAGLEEARIDGLRPVFATGIVPVMQRHGAVGIDGGTRFGVMRLFGESRAAAGATFPLVGVAAAGPVKLTKNRVGADAEMVLEPNHTHFLIVPGDTWGSEAPWIARTTTVLAANAPSITVLINGGQTALADAEQSVKAGRRVVVVAGSGRTADVLTGALTGAPADERVAALAASGLVQSVPADEPDAFAEMLTAALSETAANDASK